MTDEIVRDSQRGNRRAEPRKSWGEVTQEEAQIQRRSDEITYAAVRSGKLTENEFIAWVEELRSQATRDKLTGLENRREFLIRIAQDWNESSRSGEPLSAVVIDIDGFKELNDTFGHSVGDEVLSRMGPEALNIGLDIGAKFFRVGGEEIMVILPGVEGEELTQAVRTIGERLISNWESDKELKERGVGRITVSMGAGTSNKPGETMIEFLERIDRNLYMAKRADRNGEGRERAQVEIRDGQMTEVSFRELI